MINRCLYSTCSLLLLAGCSRSAPETSSTNTSVERAQNALDLADAPGFVLDFAASKFRIGDGASEVTELGMHKQVGADGSLALDLVTGAEYGIRNAHTVHPQFLTDVSEHEAKVMSYFLGAGLPSPQISGIHSTFSSYREDDGPTQIDHLSSIVTRSIDGIQVADSHAWATLDSAGNSIYENVYWPAIPAGVIAQARSFADLVSTSEGVFRGSLPQGLPPGRVLIHHTPGAFAGAFEATVTYDVPTATSVRRFRSDGSEAKLAVESFSLDVDGGR